MRRTPNDRATLSHRHVPTHPLRPFGIATILVRTRQFEDDLIDAALRESTRRRHVLPTQRLTRRQCEQLLVTLTKTIRDRIAQTTKMPHMARAELSVLPRRNERRLQVFVRKSVVTMGAHLA